MFITEVGYCSDSLDHDFFVAVIWTLGVRIRKAGGCFMCCTMGHTHGIIGESGDKSDLMNSGDQEVSEKKNDSMWARDWSYDILVKKVVASCPFLESLPEEEFWINFIDRRNIKSA